MRLTPSLEQELDGMKDEYQDGLAWLLNYASSMGDYGDPHGILAVLSPEGKVLVTENDIPGGKNDRQTATDWDEELREGIEKLITQWIIKNYPIGSQTFSDLSSLVFNYFKSRGYMSREEINQWLGEEGAVVPFYVHSPSPSGEISIRSYKSLRMEEK